MPQLSRRKLILIGSGALLLLALGGWIYSRRISRVALETYVPESALGYLELNDLPQLLDHLTATAAWRELAPLYGLDDKLRYAGWLGSAVRWTGIGTAESLLLTRSQFAVVVTGIEVRGDEVKPRLALIAETHGDSGKLREVVAQRLAQLAKQVYKQPQQEVSEYGGVPITIYRAPEGERRLLSAQIGSEWILANHPDPLRACIDTRQGRTPSMAHNTTLQSGRPVVEGRVGLADRSNAVFAFVSGPGVSRLLQFGANLVAGRAFNGTPFAGLLESLLADISGRALEGVAYGASFEGGGVVDRYALFFKPEVASSLNATIKVPDASPAQLSQALNLVPASATSATLINVENPDLALMGIEAAISSQIGAGQSFLLHRFVSGAREAFFGLKPGESVATAIGNEVAVVNLGTGKTPSGTQREDSTGRVWLIAVRDLSQLRALVERYLTQKGTAARRENYRGVELLISSDARRGAAAVIGNYLALGGRASLTKLIDEQQRGSSLTADPQYTAAPLPEPLRQKTAAWFSYSSVELEAAQMMGALVRLSGVGHHGAPEDLSQRLDRLPLAVSATAVRERGLYIESRSPLGNFPLFVAVVDSSISKNE